MLSLKDFLPRCVLLLSRLRDFDLYLERAYSLPSRLLRTLAWSSGVAQTVHPLYIFPFFSLDERSDEGVEDPVAS